MGLNEGTYGKLTDAELDQLSERVYRAVVRLFDAAAALHGEMSKLFTWNPAYNELLHRSGVLMAAGREQDQLFAEITGVIRGRRQQADAIARRDAILDEWADGDRWMAEAILNDEGK